MTKLDLLKEQLKTTGCISFHINDLMDADILNGEFLYNFQSDKSCYSKDMDEIKPRLQSLRADFRTTDGVRTVRKLVKKFNIDPLELEAHGFDEKFDDENRTWKYSINHTFKYYSGVHDDLVEAILSLNDCDIDQMWWFDCCNLDDHSESTYIKELYNKISSTFYPNVTEELNYNFHTTFYNKGCGIKDHQDGINPDSLYAGLVYLNNRYDTSWGGRLRLGELGEEKIFVEPTFGTISILDFTNFNPTHGVETVTNDSGRYAYLSFVSKNQKIV